MRSTPALDIGLAALCAEAVGIMEATVAATTEYLKTRQQFGQPIGRFQACSTAWPTCCCTEQARSMSYLAAMHCTNEDTAARRQRTLSAAKVTIGQACRFIAQNAVQLHGGMGMTDELILSHWFKRLTAIEMTFRRHRFPPAALRREPVVGKRAPHDGCARLRPAAALRRRDRRARHAAGRRPGPPRHRRRRRGRRDAAERPGLSSTSSRAAASPAPITARSTGTSSATKPASSSPTAAPRCCSSSPTCWPPSTARFRRECSVITVIVPDEDRPITSTPGSPAQAPYAGPPRTPRGHMAYTSGTTGRPKGVRRLPLSAEQQALSAQVAKEALGIYPGVRSLVSAPLYHSAPSSFAQQSLLQGFTVRAGGKVRRRSDAGADRAPPHRHRVPGAGDVRAPACACRRKCARATTCPRSASSPRPDRPARPRSRTP
jgi:hypothetical protein